MKPRPPLLELALAAIVLILVVWGGLWLAGCGPHHQARHTPDMQIPAPTGATYGVWWPAHASLRDMAQLKEMLILADGLMVSQLAGYGDPVPRPFRVRFVRGLADLLDAQDAIRLRTGVFVQLDPSSPNGQLLYDWDEETVWVGVGLKNTCSGDLSHALTHRNLVGGDAGHQRAADWGAWDADGIVLAFQIAAGR